MDFMTAIATGESPCPDVLTSSRFPRPSVAVTPTWTEPEYGHHETRAFLEDPSRTSIKREHSNGETPHAKRTRKTKNELLVEPQSNSITAKSGHADCKESDFDLESSDDELEADVRRLSAIAADSESATSKAPLHAFVTPRPGIPASPAPTLPSSQQKSPVHVSTGQLMSTKMNRLGSQGLDPKVEGCRNELQRITADLATLQRDAIEVIRQRSAKWLVEESSALGEQKEAVTAILDKAIRKQEAKKRRVERQRKQEAEKQRQLEAKRNSNKRQVKEEDGKKMPHVDLTKTPAIKVEPSERPDIRGAHNAGRQHLVKQETIEDEPRIKVDPDLKTEED